MKRIIRILFFCVFYLFVIYLSSNNFLFASVTLSYENTHDQVNDSLDLFTNSQNQQLDEVVILGNSLVKPSNQVSEFIPTTTFDKSLGTSLGNMLEKVNGVSSIRTGTTIAKPVIQGMSGQRILLINNGSKVTGQQWGADHAPEIDINNYSNILVIKGSDAVQYGSDALGGVLIMNSSPLPFYGNYVSGKAMLLYGSNGHKTMFTTTLEGAFPIKRVFAWRIQGTYSNSGDQSTAKYILNNTGTREYNISVSLGYNDNHLNIEANYNRYYNKIGIMASAQMGSEDMLKERIQIGKPLYTMPFSREIGYPFQAVTHQTVLLKTSYDTEKGGKFEWQGVWQQNDREEFNNRRLNSSVPTTSLHLTSFQNKLKWNHFLNNWSFNLGISVDYMNNHSLSGIGFVPIIPNFTDTQVGTYCLVKYNFEKAGIEGGIRYDYQHTHAKGYDWTGNLYGGEKDFHNITYSLGGHYHFGKGWKFISHFGVAWRAPHVFELYSNGNDLALGMFIRGDSSMNSERSYKWVTSLEYQHKYFSSKIDGFFQWINGYIYDEPTKETITVISGSYPVFQYKQTPAHFRGLEWNIGIHPFYFLSYHIIGSYIAAEERGTGNYLPYIPPLRLKQELCFQKQWDRISFSTTFTHQYVAKQNRFNPETDLIDYSPPAYHLFDWYAQVTFKWKEERALKFIIIIENIFNKEYKEYTNRARYYTHDMGRDIRISTIWTF